MAERDGREQITWNLQAFVVRRDSSPSKLYAPEAQGQEVAALPHSPVSETWNLESKC